MNGGKFLEQNSHTNDTSETHQILEGQLRECYGRVVYSHKTHEKCSDILLTRLSRIKSWQIILSALTTGGFITTFLGAGELGAGFGVAISTILLILNAYTKDYDLGELAQKHKQAANEIWFLREKYLSLLTDLATGEKPIEQLKNERDALLNSLHTVYCGSPTTTFEAYKKAQTALQTKEDLTFSAEEIDAFLPNELKRS
tara:strand:- start:324 stop:923 length:600 start_codon:yes stop_codon:yes gene_type:complete